MSFPRKAWLGTRGIREILRHMISVRGAFRARLRVANVGQSWCLAVHDGSCGVDEDRTSEMMISDDDHASFRLPEHKIVDEKVGVLLT